MLQDHATGDPIDLIEALAEASNIESQRVDETEVHVCLGGAWKDISLWFSWRPDAQVLQIGAPLELKVPGTREAEVHKLLALVNERLWIGHFDLWGQEGGIVYRNGVVLSDEQGMAPNQAESLLRAAQEAFDQYYPAFNFCVWGGRTAQESLAACVLKPMGSA